LGKQFCDRNKLGPLLLQVFCFSYSSWLNMETQCYSETSDFNENERFPFMPLCAHFMFLLQIGIFSERDAVILTELRRALGRARNTLTQQARPKSTPACKPHAIILMLSCTRRKLLGKLHRSGPRFNPRLLLCFWE
jgi:hypothetical protein